MRRPSGDHGHFGRDDVGLGEDLIDVVDEGGEGGVFALARLRKRDFEIGADVAGIAAEDDDAVGEEDGFLDVVGDEEDGFGGDGLLLPELEELAAQVVGGEDVEGGERLVHEKDFRLDDERAGESDALAHAAGELAGIGGFESVEADGVEDLEAAAMALGGFHAAGLQRRLNVLEDGEPGEEGKALEDDGDVGLGVGDVLAMPEDRAGGRAGEAGKHAQQRGFTGTGGAEEGDDLAGKDGEVSGSNDLNARVPRLRVELLDLPCLDNRFGHLHHRACGFPLQSGGRASGKLWLISM